MRQRAVLALLTLLAACGAPSGPVTIAPEDVPFSVRRSVDPVKPGQSLTAYTISFVRRGRLVGVDRALATNTTAVDAVTRALLRGPSDSEVARGVKTFIPSGTQLLAVTITDRVAQLEFGSEFQSPGPSHEILLRVAQVVRTVVSLKSVDAVRFAVNGEVIQVPTDSGPVQRPVTVLDYASVTRKANP